MRDLTKLLVLNALSGDFAPPLSVREPFTCYARGDYETGWDDVEGGDYETVGDDDDVGASAPLALRRIGPTANRAPARQPARAPARQPARPPAQPYRPPAPAGPTVEQVRQITRQEIEAALRARVPYGDVPTRPNPEEAMFPMGLGFLVLTSVAPNQTLEARPQRAFRGERLVLEAFRSAGAGAASVFVDDFQVGDYKQTVGDGLVSIGVFAPDAFGVRLMLDGSVPGVVFRIPLVGVGIPAGETVLVTATVVGRAGEAAAR